MRAPIFGQLGVVKRGLQNDADEIVTRIGAPGVDQVTDVGADLPVGVDCAGRHDDFAFVSGEERLPPHAQLFTVRVWNTEQIADDIGGHREGESLHRVDGGAGRQSIEMVIDHGLQRSLHCRDRARSEEPLQHPANAVVTRRIHRDDGVLPTVVIRILRGGTEFG